MGRADSSRSRGSSRLAEADRKEPCHLSALGNADTSRSSGFLKLAEADRKKSHDLNGLGRAGHTRDGGRDGLPDGATTLRRAGDGAPHSICTSVTCSKQWSGRHVFHTATAAWSTRLRGYGGYGGYGTYEISGVAGG